MYMHMHMYKYKVLSTSSERRVVHKRVQRCDSIWYSSTDMRGKKAKSRPNGAKLGSTKREKFGHKFEILRDCMRAECR